MSANLGAATVRGIAATGTMPVRGAAVDQACAAAEPSANA
jgi:hypothetical protein